MSFLGSGLQQTQNCGRQVRFFFPFSLDWIPPLSPIDRQGHSFMMLATCRAVRLQTRTIGFKTICHELSEVQATFVLFRHLDAALSSMGAFRIGFCLQSICLHTEKHCILIDESASLLHLLTVLHEQQIPSRQLACQFCNMQKIQRVE